MTERLIILAEVGDHYGMSRRAVTVMRDAALSWADIHSRMWDASTSPAQRQTMLPEANRRRARALRLYHAHSGKAYCGGPQS
ncbi:hypothetical protein P7L78_22050 [Tistrella bauzanensis]|uniref:hypothetical protein n=1 Tax=Tistrella bauzanensis TaxID=657419 RepID=UPI0031FB7B17